MKCRTIIPTTVLHHVPRLISTQEELARMLDAAGNLRHQKPSPLRRHVYVMLIGLLASTGLRISEALNLRLGDVLPDGVLHIRQTKFNKNRLVPMHASVVEALHAYLNIRLRFAGILGALCCGYASYQFRRFSLG